MMATYASRVKADIERWREQGLIDADTARGLAGDVDARGGSSPNFGSVLAIFAAILFGASILLFVAANWEGIPRLVRVGLLFFAIFAGYVGGSALKGRGQDAFGDAFWLVGAASFGGSIALVGQMYHLSGDEAQAVLTWCAGTAIAAVALRSGVLTWAAVILAGVWLSMRGFDFAFGKDFPAGYVVLAAALWLVSLWTGSAVARHLLLVSVLYFMVLLAAHNDLEVVPEALAAGSAVVLTLAGRWPGAVERIVRIGGHLPEYGLVGFLTGMTLVQVDQIENGVAPLVAAAAVTFGGIAGALLVAGRASRGVRWIAYLGFAFELCFVYAVLLGSMLGTAGFFLAAAAILGLLAFVIIRVENRVKSASYKGAGA